MIAHLQRSGASILLCLVWEIHIVSLEKLLPKDDMLELPQNAIHWKRSKSALAMGVSMPFQVHLCTCMKQSSKRAAVWAQASESHFPISPEGRIGVTYLHKAKFISDGPALATTQSH